MGSKDVTSVACCLRETVGEAPLLDAPEIGPEAKRMRVVPIGSVWLRR